MPLDFTLTEGPQLVLPLDAAPLGRYDALAPGVEAYPVLRRTASVAGSGTTVLSPDRDRAARRRAREAALAVGLLEPLARRDLAAPRRRAARPRCAGVPLPAGTRALSIDGRVHGVPVLLELVAENAEQQLGEFSGSASGAPADGRSPPGCRQACAAAGGRADGRGRARSTAHQLAHGEAEGASAVVPVGLDVARAAARDDRRGGPPP